MKPGRRPFTHPNAIQLMTQPTEAPIKKNAVLTVQGFPSMKPGARRSLVAWLRTEAERLEAEGLALSPNYQSNFVSQQEN